jgi:hypothetical protein
MSEEYESVLINEFQEVNIENITVKFGISKLFVCGGVIDVKNIETPSFRDRFCQYAASKFPNIHDKIVLAETFNDYFRDNTYPDLLAFEEDIANISSLVIIILESPGALVELGMFCNKPNLYKKLLIVVNEEHTKSEDSFIYLGPITYIKKREPDSVAIYAWSTKAQKEDCEHLDDLCEIVVQAQKKQAKTGKFKLINSGHISLLISEIITNCYPILIGEIELALEAIDIHISTHQISRHLYMLRKLEIIERKDNGNSHGFYYPIDPTIKYVSFGRTKKNRFLDPFALKLVIRKTFSNEDPLSKRRKRLFVRINKEIGGELFGLIQLFIKNYSNQQRRAYKFF